MGFDAIDWIVIACHFVIIMPIAARIMRQRRQSSTDHFLARRQKSRLVIGTPVSTSDFGPKLIAGPAGQKRTTGVLLSKS